MMATVQARARPKPGVMNKTEAAYAELLELRRKAGEIAEWRFEEHRFVIGTGRCTYTPDFMVLLPSGIIEFHEVKGHWADDALVKIKVAAKQNWFFRFLSVQKVAKKHGGGWAERDF